MKKSRSFFVGWEPIGLKISSPAQFDRIHEIPPFIAGIVVGMLMGTIVSIVCMH